MEHQFTHVFDSKIANGARNLQFNGSYFEIQMNPPLLIPKEAKSCEIKISISGIRRIIRDYQIVCENYVEAIKTAPLKKIEAIDVGRRTIHDEGAETIIELFNNKLEVDIDTARRLFTLISIISIKI